MICVSTKQSSWKAECEELCRSGQEFTVEDVFWDYQVFFCAGLARRYDRGVVWNGSVVKFLAPVIATN
jgi:hypothetical protein